MTDLPPPPQRARFHAMTEGTQEDWMVIASHSWAFARDLPGRIMSYL
jgi:hypothetical protein